jgi:hypothetical protein
VLIDRLPFLLLGLSALACNGSHKTVHVDLPKDQVWTSPHFRYAARADDPEVCGGVVDELEIHLQALTTYLGLPWNGGVISYYKFRDLADYQTNSPCPTGTGGCTKIPPEVHSPLTLHGHELVHIYMSMGSGVRPPGLFEEGIAEALSPEGRTFPAPRESWREVMAIPPPEEESPVLPNYWSGGWFVSYLLRHFGPAPFVTFYKAATSDHSASAIAQAFQNAYGLSLDDVWSQAQASTPRIAGIPVWECVSAEPLAFGEAGTSLSDRCDGRGHFARLDLAKPTAFTWSGSDTTGFAVSSCSVEQWLYTAMPLADLFGGTVALPAGKYYVSPFEGSQGTVSFGQASGVLASDCHSLSPLVLRDTGPSSLRVAIANSDVPWFAMPEMPGSTSFTLTNRSYPNAEATAATVEVCDTCEGPCRTLALLSEAQISNGMVLRFTNLTALDGATQNRLDYSEAP